MATKDDKIWALEQELEVAKKLTEENEAARKTVEERVEKMHQEFDDYQKRKHESVLLPTVETSLTESVWVAK